MTVNAGNKDQSIVGLRDGQHAQKEVHGSVEVTVNADDSDNNDVPSQSENVGDEENHKEGYLVISKNGESQEDEFCHFCEVLSLHSAISVS